MGDLRLVSWNMEWLDDLFVAGSGAAAFRADTWRPEHNKNTTVGQRKERLSKGLHALDADVVVVVEGPSRQAELELLFRDLAPGEWKVFLQRSVSRNSPDPERTDKFTSLQCVGVAVRIDTGKFAAEPMRVFDSLEAASGKIFAASEPFFFDSGANGVVEYYRFERRPAYVELTMADGAVFRIMGVHLKSKGIFDALEWSRWWAMADANRERLLAQCRHVREKFLDDYLVDAATRHIPLVICGDINDGPGFDTSEMRLLASGVETLMGSVWHPHLTLGNALFDRLAKRERERLDFEKNATTSFKDPIFGTTQKEWIDHILYSRNALTGWVHSADVVKSRTGISDFDAIADHYPVEALISLPPVI